MTQSVLDILRSPKSSSSFSSKPKAGPSDPTIAGAVQGKRTVVLGFDSGFQPKVREAYRLNRTVKNAKSALAELETELRDYGREKRKSYNETFHTNFVTVEVPFTIDGSDNKSVQVICTNQYSVDKKVVLGLETELGDMFPRLFEKTERKVLKSDAGDLVVKLLEELGLNDEERQNAMDKLFETETKVKASKVYETEVESVSGNTRAILDKAVKRNEPGLKFPE